MLTSSPGVGRVRNTPFDPSASSPAKRMLGDATTSRVVAVQTVSSMAPRKSSVPVSALTAPSPRLPKVITVNTSPAAGVNPVSSASVPSIVAVPLTLSWS